MTRRKLIEAALPLAAINHASVTDKRTHDGHISTLHTWWARRPLPMARAMAAAALIEEGADASEVLSKIGDAMPPKRLLYNDAVGWL